jgi:hypothetical protein
MDGVQLCKPLDYVSTSTIEVFKKSSAPYHHPPMGVAEVLCHRLIFAIENVIETCDILV